MSDLDANAAYNAAYDHGFRAGTAMGADRIEALEAALQEAIDELRWHDAVAAANKASAALAPEQTR